jgi:hypothetical protein
MSSRESVRPWDRRTSVTIQAAAELVNVDTKTIRRWSDSGFIEIEWRGDMEVVRLDLIEAVAASQRRLKSREHSGLRARLEGAVVGEPDVGALQQIARERTK